MRFQLAVTREQEMQSVPVRADKQKADVALLLLPLTKRLLRIVKLLPQLLQIRPEERLCGLGVALESGELLGCDSSINGFDTLAAGRGAVFAEVNSLLRLSVHHGGEVD